MRARSRIAAPAGLFLVPFLFACGAAKAPPDQSPVVTQFTEASSPSGQARHAQEAKSRADMEQCRSSREQGVYARERRFPCEAFLGE
ncbi:MAG: hypothetical protein JO306_13075 [Gemmatimonadetes bacterium]|nr:hypothetical protein [Gemmatimonadota bacterium]